MDFDRVLLIGLGAYMIFDGDQPHDPGSVINVPVVIIGPDDDDEQKGQSGTGDAPTQHSFGHRCANRSHNRRWVRRCCEQSTYRKANSPNPPQRILSTETNTPIQRAQDYQEDPTGTPRRIVRVRADRPRPGEQLWVRQQPRICGR